MICCYCRRYLITLLSIACTYATVCGSVRLEHDNNERSLLVTVGQPVKAQPNLYTNLSLASVIVEKRRS